MSRLRRFLHIERPRARQAEVPVDWSPDTAERFESVERPSRGKPPPPASGAELGRFGPEPPPALELLETEAGERPFTRCMRCGMDHHLFATECTGCGASLDTAPQHEFNERLWARRQEEAARETRAAAARTTGADAELSSARRALGEELARQVGERERRRLQREMGGGLLAWLRDLLRARRR